MPTIENVRFEGQIDWYLAFSPADKELFCAWKYISLTRWPVVIPIHRQESGAPRKKPPVMGKQLSSFFTLRGLRAAESVKSLKLYFWYFALRSARYGNIFIYLVFIWPTFYTTAPSITVRGHGALSCWNPRSFAGFCLILPTCGPERKPAWVGFELTSTALLRDSWVIILRHRTNPLSHRGPGGNFSIPPNPNSACNQGPIPMYNSDSHDVYYVHFYEPHVCM